MSIRNILLGGGSDWADAEILFAVDLNDTFDAAYDVLENKTAFWLDSQFYTVYDTFDSIIDGSKWTNATVGSGAVAWSNTNNAGGLVIGEANISTTGDGVANSAYLISNAIPNNRRGYNIKGYIVLSGVGAASTRSGIVSFRQRDGTNTSFFTMGSGRAITGNVPFSIFVIKTATDTYDVYIGGKIITTVSDADLEIGVYCTATGTAGNTQVVNVYIDDVFYTNS